MKNSLFMRAVAAAAAVPVALTQCLTVASAVSVSPVAPATANDSLVTASETNITLTGNGGLLYIQPQEILKNVYTNDANVLSSVYGITDTDVFVKDSNWNILALDYISKSTRTSGTIDPAPFKKAILEEVDKIRGGEFSQLAKQVLDRLTDKDVTFEIVNNDIIVKASLNNAVFNGDIKGSIGGAMAELAKESGAEELANVNYKADASGDFKLTIHTSDLATSTKVAADFEFVPKTTGKAIGLGQLPEFALDILNSLTDDAVAAINNCDKLTAAEKTDAIAKINSGMDRYKDKFVRINNRIEKAKVADKTYEYNSVADVISAVNQEILKRGYHKQIPATASDIMANPNVKEVYDNAITRFNDASENYNINIAADLLGAQVDRIYDIKGTTKAGEAVTTAKYPDDEQKAVKDFFQTSAKYKDLYEFQDSWKEIRVEADFKNIDEVEAGSADIKFYRVVKVKPKAVVTTTTTEAPVTTVSTEPVTTVSTEPVTEPITTEPVTEPVTTISTEPVTEPITTEPVTEPITTEPVTEPITTEPITTEPVTEPITTEPVTEPITTEPVTEPITTEPVTEPITTEPVTEPITTEPVTEPITTEPVTEPITTEPVTEPVTTTTTAEPIVVPGTTRTEIVNVPVIKADKTVGFYLDVDEEFHKEQVTKLVYSIDTVRQYIDEDNNILSWESIATGTPVDITDKFDFGFATPVNTYDSTDLTFAYQVALKATEDITDGDTVIAKKGSSFKNPDNSDVSVTAYIGVKGDANLDNKVDSGDATTTLVYYANISTGQKPENTQFSISKLVTGPDDILDHFATFLCDTTNEPYPQSPGSTADNWKLMKGDRKILSDDATFILSYYTELSLNAPKGRETWNKVQGLND